MALRRSADSPVPCESPLRSFIQELERAYSFFNWRFLGNALPAKVVISVGKTKPRVAGWFSASFESNPKKSSMPHICISITAMTSPMQLCHVLLHEMAHLRNCVLGIKDVRRAHYHNRHFRDSALLFGLDCGWRKSSDCRRTRLNARGEAAVYSLGPDFSMIGLKQLEREK